RMSRNTASTSSACRSSRASGAVPAGRTSAIPGVRFSRYVNSANAGSSSSTATMIRPSSLIGHRLRVLGDAHRHLRASHRRGLDDKAVVVPERLPEAFIDVRQADMVTAGFAGQAATDDLRIITHSVVLHTDPALRSPFDRRDTHRALPIAALEPMA